MSEQEPDAYWAKNTETEITPSIAGEFEKRMLVIANRVLEEVEYYAVLPGELSRRLETDNLELELSAAVSTSKKKSSQVVEFTDVRICLSEVEDLPDVNYFDRLLISHTIYIENDQVIYELRNYLINDIEGITNEVFNQSRPTVREKKKLNKMQKLALVAIEAAEPTLTAEKLEYLTKLVDEVVEAHIGTAPDD